MTKDFRGDIQGLRALAVVLVAIEHAHLGFLRGGYIGVDVFFVISGFLITGLLLAERRRTGHISLLSFYARRARRILPAATLVLLATTATSLLLLNALDAQSAARDAVWVLFFAANVKFGRDGTDYFQRSDAPSPFQHYWSLSVEEQFYFVWPLVLLALLVLLPALAAARGRRRSASASDVPAALALLVVVAVSFAYCVHLTAASPTGAYFSFPARIWELALGALGACLVPAVRRAPAPVRTAMSVVGLVAIAYAAVVFGPTTLFPGAAAAVPVVGALLLLLGGVPAEPARTSWVQRGLSVRPVRAVGDWSYSFYLWHWPILVIAGQAWRPARGLTGALLLVLALGLSALTYRFVENPVRQARALRDVPWRGVAVYPATLAVALPLVLGGSALVTHLQRPSGAEITLANYGQHPGEPRPSFSPDPAVALVQASLVAADNGMPIPGNLRPDPFDLDVLKPDVGDCDYLKVAWPKLCPMGDPEGTRTMVVLGDSHGRQWVPALERIAEREGFRAYWLVREGCTGADVTPWGGTKGPAVNCAAFQDWSRSVVADLEPDVTIIGAEADPNLGYAADDGSHVTDPARELRMFEDGVRRTVEDVAPHSGRTIFFLDPPATRFKAVSCLSKRGATLEGCVSRPAPLAADYIAATARGAAAGGAEVLDPASWFCFRGRCPAVVGHYVTRRDKSHITVEYAVHLTDALADRLRLLAGLAASS